MIKETVRKIVNTFGYDVGKLPQPAQPIYLKNKVGDSLEYYETPIGNYYLPINTERDVIAIHMREAKVFEPEVVEIAERYIKKGTAALDVGSNFGQMALFFSSLVGESGTVYAFEAQKPIYEILCRNIEANRVGNVKPFFNAVYFESNQTFHFPEPDFIEWGAYGSYNLPLDATAGHAVTSLKIDDLRIEQPISFMKVDVQGCDLFAMQGAVETIKKHRMPILFEFEQQFQQTYKTNFQDYVAFADSIGYKFVELVMNINYLIEPK